MKPQPDTYPLAPARARRLKCSAARLGVSRACLASMAVSAFLAHFEATGQLPVARRPR